MMLCSKLADSLFESIGLQILNHQYFCLLFALMFDSVISYVGSFRKCN